MIEVKESSIHHRGVFATKYIKEGTKIIAYTGEKITTEEAERREQENDKLGVTYIVVLDDDYCIDGAVGGNDAIYINHSCDPNTVPEMIDDEIWVVATKDIKKGEEITYDYEFPHDDKVRNKCFCLSHNCRGHIQMHPPKNN